MLFTSSLSQTPLPLLFTYVNSCAESMCYPKIVPLQHRTQKILFIAYSPHIIPFIILTAKEDAQIILNSWYILKESSSSYTQSISSYSYIYLTFHSTEHFFNSFSQFSVTSVSLHPSSAGSSTSALYILLLRFLYSLVSMCPNNYMFRSYLFNIFLLFPHNSLIFLFPI